MPVMTHPVSTFSIQKPARRALCLSAALLFAILLLPGCQSEQERKIAEAKDLAIRQAQKPQPTTVVPGKDGPPVDFPVRSSEPVPASGKPAPATPPKLALSLPIFPGAQMSGTEGAELGVDDSGIHMALLETRATPDEVIAFYQKQMEYEQEQPGGGTHTVQPSPKENRLDGKRVVILTRPQKDGALQTVEVREGEGKTLIQLMEVQGGKLPGSLAAPTGLSPESGSTSKHIPLDQDPMGMKPVPPASGTGTKTRH